MHQSFPCAPSPRLLRWHVRGEPPRLSTSSIIWGTAPFFNTFPHPFPHPAPPLHSQYVVKHPRAYVRKHNMLCLQQRRDATCGTPPFNLNLQVDLEAIFASLYMPFTSPPNSPTQGTCGPPPRCQVAKNGTGPRLPMRAQKHAAAIWGPSPKTYKYTGQRCVNDAPAGAPPDRPRSVAYDRHACKPAWSIYRHVPRSPVAHGGLRRPQAYG